MSEKNLFKKILKPAVTTLVTASLLFGVVGGVNSVSNASYGDYITITEAESLANEFGCDLSYWQSNGMRMKHNADEPIYVSISNEFSDTERKDIIKSLDYVFGIVGGINPNYYYEIVESVNDSSYKNKVVLKIGIKQSSNDVDGVQMTDKTSKLARFTGKGTFGLSNEVLFDPDFLESNKEAGRLYGVSVHELLHCFGIDDVYCLEDGTYYSNTFLNPMVEDDGLIMITPNDYLILFSMYPEKFKSQQEKDSYVEAVKKFIEQYSKEYYNMHYKARVQGYREFGYSENRINQLTAPVNENIELSFEACSNLETTKLIEVVVKNGKYKIFTYDKNSNFIDEFEGDAFYVNGQIYLQDVQLEKFMKDKYSRLDMYICKDAMTDTYSLSDLGGIDISINGLEKSALNNKSQPEQ